MLELAGSGREVAAGVFWPPFDQDGGGVVA
jgi:hypothetical protein